MAAGTRSRGDRSSEPDRDGVPEISCCESKPGTAVFIESGNADGWIASDLTVTVRR